MTTFTVRAQRWARGWELDIDGVGVTQSHSLANAEGMARDYIALDLDIEPDSFDVNVTPVVGDGLDQAIRAARALTQAAGETQRAAAAQARHVARQLKAKGLSGRDIAQMLDVTPGRVSQLLSSDRRSRQPAPAPTTLDQIHRHQ